MLIFISIFPNVLSQAIFSAKTEKTFNKVNKYPNIKHFRKYLFLSLSIRNTNVRGGRTQTTFSSEFDRVLNFHVYLFTLPTQVLHECSMFEIHRRHVYSVIPLFRSAFRMQPRRRSNPYKDDAN